MTTIWTQASGYDFGTNATPIQERQVINLPLPVTGLSGVTYSLISGQLPKGLRLSNSNIVGTALEVSRRTESVFVVRASYNGIISDRTFRLFVEGADAPVWITDEGRLPVGPNNLTFVIDNTYIDFQLEALDPDLSAGDSLEFFIADGDGSLPPGLTLDTNGRITGIIDPILALDITARTGFFDTNLFDAYPYDFGQGQNISNPEFENVITPRKLNRNYEFTVSVSDGEIISKRTFRIYVVGDDFLRADNTIVQIGDGTFTADNTYLRSPIWLSASNLGLRRANNYVTISLDAYDPNPDIGPVIYRLKTTNPDLSVSQLPDGLYLDENTGELFGFVPFQPAVTREYNFTIAAVKYDKEDLTQVEVQIVVADNAPLGQKFLRINPLPAEDQSLIVNDNIRIGETVYRITEYISQTVVGGPNAELRLDTNLINSVSQGTIISKIYNQSVTEFTTQTSEKTFTLGILGEVDSVIRFLTDNNLGVLKSNFPSTLAIEAETSVPNAVLTYTVTQGNLPPGLTLSSSGNLVGKVNQFRETGLSGFTIFDGNNTTFDGNDMTLDRSYTFTVLAADQYRYSAISQEFTLFVSDEDITLYSNIYGKPLPKKSKRDLFYNFITDTSIFTPNKIYRLGDPNFGVQTDLKMLVYAGIETEAVANYVAALSKNAKRKRFKLGEVKKAVAKRQGSNDILYEVIYIEALDDYENVNGSVASSIKLPTYSKSPIKINQTRTDVIQGRLGTTVNGDINTYDSTAAENKLNENLVDRFRSVLDPITVDSKNVKVSGKDLETVYPTSITNIRNNIRNIAVEENDSTVRQLKTESEFLPLWMLTPQDARTAATGYVKAIPLCYCKPGEGNFILENIQNSSFDFTELDYELDRFIIDSTLGNTQEQYLKFTNHKYNV